MIYYAAIAAKDSVGNSLGWLARNKSWIVDHVGYREPTYAALIGGFAVVEPEDGNPTQFFMNKDTPYIIWREDGGSVDQCFFMRLDHRNPQECEGGDLSPDAALAAVVQKISQEGTPEWPDELIKGDIEYQLRHARRRAAQRRTQRADTFWSTSTSTS